jgi:hypothetical protein
MGEMVEVVGHRMVVHKEVEVHRTVMDREVVEDGLAFDNVVADNIEAAECMAENIGAGNIVIGNIGAGNIVIGNIGAGIHSLSSGILLGIHSRSLKDSHHILADCNYID